VAQSKALEFLQKRALNIIFSVIIIIIIIMAVNIRDKFDHCQRRKTESRRQSYSVFLQTVTSLGGMAPCGWPPDYRSTVRRLHYALSLH